MALRFSLMLSVFLLPLCLFNSVNGQWIDMSYKYNNKTIYWGTSTRFVHKANHQGPFGDIPYYSSFDIKTAEHGGTHLDAPVHFAEGKWSVDQIPPEKLVGKAVVVNISAKASRDRNAQLTVADLKAWEDTHGKIPDGSIVFVFTGWGKYWPDLKKYMGTNTTDSSLYRFPGIHKNSSQWLVNNRKIKGVGIDTASLDYGRSALFPSHQILLGENIYGLENVANLDKLPPTGATVYALPMNIEDGSGGPARIFATVRDDNAGSNSGDVLHFSSICLIISALVHFVKY